MLQLRFLRFVVEADYVCVLALPAGNDPAFPG